ncbi:MAG TPA: clostripain-related cysteine peptidase [Atribacteraceae bacterium]|nr:clostripain-related cysteine peptidase [Atribacteraceae bacterium]
MVKKRVNRHLLAWALRGILTLVLVIAAGCTPGVMPPRPDGRGGDWTVMVFLSADNDLERFGWEDLREMEMVGSTSRVNIVVQFDTYTGPAKRYHVMRTPHQSYLTAVSSPVLQELGEVNMGDPVTLVDFVRFATERFPARHYALVVWSHGSGFKEVARNISFDDSAFRDSITIPELGWALSQATTYTRGPLEFLSLDACLMNLVEVAYEVRPYARVMVASQDNVPPEGLDYQGWLSRLIADPALDGFALAQAAADTYLAYFAYAPVTQSVIDLGRIGSLAQALDRFAREVVTDRWTSRSVYVDVGNTAVFFQGDYDYIDLIDFLILILGDERITNPQVRVAAQEALAQAQAAVFYNRAGGFLAGRAQGISIYFPYRVYHLGYDQLAFARDTAWDDMLRYLGIGRRGAGDYGAPATTGRGS